MTHEKALAFAPVDQQVFTQKHGDDHAQTVVHPAGFQQLAQGGIDDWKAGARLLPGSQVRRGIAPGQGFGLRAKGPVPGHPWIAHQNVLVELPPQ
ncbi:hypothetical protein D3C85_1656080 [compost metagenome]